MVDYISIDPGWSTGAAASWSGRTLVGLERISAPKGEQDPLARTARVGRWVASFIDGSTQHGPLHVVIERLGRGGVYGARGLSNLEKGAWGTGAILHELSRYRRFVDVELVTHTAWARGRKNAVVEFQTLALARSGQMGPTATSFARARKWSEHEVHAVALGWYVLHRVKGRKR